MSGQHCENYDVKRETVHRYPRNVDHCCTLSERAVEGGLMSLESPRVFFKICLCFRVRFFGMIQIRISDPRSLRSWRIKGTEESTMGKGFSVPLMRHDLSDLGSLILIWIIPKERTLNHRFDPFVLLYNKSLNDWSLGEH